LINREINYDTVVIKTPLSRCPLMKRQGGHATAMPFLRQPCLKLSFSFVCKNQKILEAGDAHLGLLRGSVPEGTKTDIGPPNLQDYRQNVYSFFVY